MSVNVIRVHCAGHNPQFYYDYYCIFYYFFSRPADIDLIPIHAPANQHHTTTHIYMTATLRYTYSHIHPRCMWSV